MIDPGRCCMWTSKSWATSPPEVVGGSSAAPKVIRTVRPPPGITRRRRQPHLGYAFVHTVIDDHSRVAYAEIHDNETADIAIAVLRRAVSWFSARGVSVERVLSDNGSCYKSRAWRDACAQLQIKHKRTRPYRPLLTG
jgi:transposase InsO family protein